MFRKFVLSSIAALILFLSSSASFVHAQGPWYDQTFQQWYTKVYDTSNQQEIFGERYTAAQVQWVIYGLFSYIMGMMLPNTVWQCMMSVFSDCAPGLTDTSLAPSDLASSKVSIPSSMSEVMFAERPLSGITYTKDKLRNFHIIPEAKAQTGFGYGAFGMIQGLWGAARNISYSLMTLVILVFAFMIMFRTKISPQLVISIQSSLPKVVIALILITFSYAIAGFMVDIMYVTLGIVALLFTSSGLAMSISFWGPDGAANLFNLLVNGPMNTGMAGLLMIYWGYFMGTLIAATLFPGAFGSALGLLFATNLTIAVAPISMIVNIIVSVMLLIISFRVFFTLIKIFVNTILLVVAGPFLILLGAVSPASGGFSGWIRNLAANLAVYPVIALLFLVSLVFLNAAYSSTTIGVASDWVPGFSTFMDQVFATTTGISVNAGVDAGTTWVPPLTFGADLGIVWLWLFASVSVLALIPKSADIVKGFISGKPFAYGTAMGEAITGPIAGALSVGAFVGATKQRKAQDVYGPGSPQDTRWAIINNLLSAAQKRTK